jgi:indolepyruvate ferredoxin oxidoreductase beta subunit
MKNFNIILTGVGGQGIITLLSLIVESAFVEGFDVRSSELHGLSQRGGSVESHIRFGKKVDSPLILNGTADLIMALEMTEALRESEKSGKDTKILVNDNFLSFNEALNREEVKKQLGSLKNQVTLVPASQVCTEKLQKEVVSSIYLLGYAVAKKMIPFKEESVLKAIENVIPEKYQELNIKAFKLGYDN